MRSSNYSKHFVSLSCNILNMEIKSKELIKCYTKDFLITTYIISYCILSTSVRFDLVKIPEVTLCG